MTVAAAAGTAGGGVTGVAAVAVAMGAVGVVEGWGLPLVWLLDCHEARRVAAQFAGYARVRSVLVNCDAILWRCDVGPCGTGQREAGSLPAWLGRMSRFVHQGAATFRRREPRRASWSL